jgi:glycosylphosphatidylinositol transamidase (GPIT) subunit GPI8
MLSTPGIRTDLFHRNLSHVRLTDFFGGVQNIELTSKGYSLESASKGNSLQKGSTLSSSMKSRPKPESTTNDNVLFPLKKEVVVISDQFRLYFITLSLGFLTVFIFS